MVLELPVAVFLVMLVVYLGMHLVLVRSPEPRNRSLLSRAGRRPAGRQRRPGSDDSPPEG